ncbi:Hypothetical protein NTJ_14132 [Nesidiocoris tenuis]|uniref:Uncharacterized protein n=1 Tax=Nesidiocoris tenuis TaxID=355587 RepID=A0ABN7BAA8_9HEMI|nr:Hypothetical protein NTJ_14132 [Nesidiocoris tenuis]
MLCPPPDDKRWDKSLDILPLDNKPFKLETSREYVPDNNGLKNLSGRENYSEGIECQGRRAIHELFRRCELWKWLSARLYSSTCFAKASFRKGA